MGYDQCVKKFKKKIMWVLNPFVNFFDKSKVGIYAKNFNDAGSF